ncbi:MAG: dihydrofolate reductase family protein [Mesobacillus sp.]|uniref:dihydrofolate reductase family protein n=1 Tax=Mesobacillus sp. TaxID=2675271 RepID=UPI003C4C6F24
MNNERNLAIYIATSLDGYIAREDDSLDWLFKVEGEGDNGYSLFYETVDTILIGKRTYDWVMEHENGDFPYKNKECYVFSRTAHENTEFVKFISGNVVDFTNTLKREEGKRIWLVGGGELIHSFLKEKLVDELIMTVAPVLIGKGICLFKEFDFDLEFSLKGMKQFNQFAELHYEVKK